MFLPISPETPIDLQLHTTYSDGRWSTEHLFEYLAKEGFGLVAVTDHRRKLREKRLQAYREEIRQIALQLQAEQVVFTQKRIRRYLSQPAILRDPSVRGLLREVCHEVEKHPSHERASQIKWI